MGANDLTANLRVGDYYVQYVPTVREHRIHVFDGEVIRVQMKVPRVAKPHPRFRSYDNGWKLVAGPEYTAQVPRGARELAKRAVAAMGYVFGAVDIGVKTDGTAIVWEVNTQPGIEGGTVDQYARAVVRYFDGR
jgi:glutathione synthase/RimK-type ligase-like ATP-grasp enzyme